MRAPSCLSFCASFLKRSAFADDWLCSIRSATTDEHDRDLDYAEEDGKGEGWPGFGGKEGGLRWLRYLLELWWKGLQRRARRVWFALWRVKTN